MKYSFSLILTLLAITSISFRSYSQTDDEAIVKDSLLINNQEEEEIETEKRKRLISFIDGSSDLDKNHSPSKAAIYSAAFPGLGQIYNKRYWKLPIIYGVTGFLIFQTIQTHREYVSYRDALFLIDISQLTDSNFELSTSNNPLFAFSRAAVESRKDTFRATRDRLIVWASLFYIINIVDAVVDAHLVNFDTSKKRLVNISPELLPAGQALVPGINLQLNF